jgi:hypothetical protein
MNGQTSTFLLKFEAEIPEYLVCLTLMRATPVFAVASCYVPVSPIRRSYAESAFWCVWFSCVH